MFAYQLFATIINFFHQHPLPSTRPGHNPGKDENLSGRFIATPWLKFSNVSVNEELLLSNNNGTYILNYVRLENLLTSNISRVLQILSE
ncbi:hypothetical protein CEXT_336161 [Caerostris extrusa]|uniref:Uncharacterized protein n=1 Tax=Caerostris extrusa TaxID=172846 RepID=A0AAV4S6R4_CAEEX|nr:hypothetical protein CEXT_336161 [Caerostris extrusa]